MSHVAQPRTEPETLTDAESRLAEATDALECLSESLSISQANRAGCGEAHRMARAFLSRTPAPAAHPLPWRQGTRVPEHIYSADDRPIVTMPSAEMAARVVAAVNATAPAAPCVPCAYAFCDEHPPPAAESEPDPVMIDSSEPVARQYWKLRRVQEDSARAHEARIADLERELLKERRIAQIDQQLKDVALDANRTLAAATEQAERELAAAREVRDNALQSHEECEAENEALRAAIDAAVVELDPKGCNAMFGCSNLRVVKSALSLLRAAQKAAT